MGRVKRDLDRQVWAQVPTQYIADAFESMGCESILSIGCGTGGAEIEVALKGPRVRGIDCCRKAVEIARYKARSLNQPKEEFVESVWEKVKPYAGILFETQKWTDNFDEWYRQHTAGDYPERTESYVKQLPFELPPELDFRVSDALKKDFRRVAPRKLDGILLEFILGHLPITYANTLLNRAIQALPENGVLCLIYAAEMGGEIGIINQESTGRYYVNLRGYGIVGHKLDEVMEKIGFVQEEASKTLEQNVRGYLAPGVDPLRPCRYSLNSYLGRKQDDGKRTLREAIIEVLGK